jgi:hypothetical protein
MTNSYRFQFPRLFRQWTSHDLALHDGESIRPEFYEGLRREDEPKVWGSIEENYLLKYKRPMVRICFDWMADGLWEIPFPGSVMMGAALSPGYFGMPERLATRIQRWQSNLDSRDVGADPEEEDFDYEASDAEAVEIAKEVKLFLGEDYYVEFRPIREIALRNGEPVELDIPRFITELSG